jgi:hypothetical protein
VARHDAGSMIDPNVDVGLHIYIYINRTDFQETSLLYLNRPTLALPTKPTVSIADQDDASTLVI